MNDTGDDGPETGAMLATEATSVGALGIVRHEGGTATVLVPMGPEGDVGRQRGSLNDGVGRPEARVVTSRHTRAEIERAVQVLTAYAGGSDGGGHAFGIHYDAHRDAVAVITDAPAEQREALQERMGPIAHVEYGTVARRGRGRSRLFPDLRAG